MNYSLLPSVATVNDILSNFTQSDGFWADSETALSANYNMVKATEPEEQWQSQNFNQSSSIAAAENDTISPLPGQNNLKTTELKRQWQSQDFNQSSSIDKLSRGVVATAGNDTINPLTGQDNVKTTELEQHWQSQDFSQLTSTERFSVGVLAIADNGTINSLPEQNSVDGGVENNLSIFDYSSNTDGVSASSFSSQKQIIVKFKKGITLDQVNQYKSLIGAISSRNISLTGAQSWKLPGSISVDNIIQKYRSNSIFEYIEPDYIITKEDKIGRAHV